MTTSPKSITKAAALGYISAISAEINRERKKENESKPTPKVDKSRDGKRLIVIA